MAYRFGDTQLRVVHSRLVTHASLFTQARFLILGHILPTTVEFVRLLRSSGADVFGVIAKPYSIDQAALLAIRELDIRVVEEATYAEIEDKVVGNLLREAQAKSDDDGRKIVVIDVGGYFARPLAKGECRHVAGVVEDTTFGHNRYIKAAQDIKVPVLSVARSELKEIEARFVGKDAVVAMDLMLRDVGVSISGRRALVIGYGMIGRNVARTLKRYDLKVSVYDKKDTMNLRAHADGFGVQERRRLVPEADIIFSATGSEAIYGVPALSYAEMEDLCQTSVVLASVGSRKSEFDIEELKKRATRKEEMSPQLVKYKLTKDVNLIVARDGAAVNFQIASIPVEILDLVFSEITVCASRLLARDSKLAVGSINELSGDSLHSIAKDWLRLANQA